MIRKAHDIPSSHDNAPKAKRRTIAPIIEQCQQPKQVDPSLVGIHLPRSAHQIDPSWQRPPLPDHLVPNYVNDSGVSTYYKRDGPTNTHEICFQKMCIETDDIDTERLPLVSSRHNSAYDTKNAMIRLFGISQEGFSVAANVYGFLPYFWIRLPQLPPSLINKNQIESSECDMDLDVSRNASSSSSPFIQKVHRAWLKSIKEQLNEKMDRSLFGKRNDFCTNRVRDVSVEHAYESIMGYTDSTSSFVKITLGHPKYISMCRVFLEVDGLDLYGYNHLLKVQTFESTAEFILSFMIDTQMFGVSWVSIPTGSATHVPQPSKYSTCQIEIDVHYKDLVVHKPDGEWIKVAPMRILSFDIEVAGRRDHFPSADIDPVIQISNYVKTYSGDEICKNVFVLGSCDNIEGVDIRCFRTESDLLNAWKSFFCQIDPDILIGYNIVNFDIPYLINRAKRLGLGMFDYNNRLQNSPTEMKLETFSSKAYGTKDSFSFSMHGRACFDMMQVIMREKKLGTYTLNSVSAEILGEQKEDLHFSLITPLHNGSSADRRRLASYCMQDSNLPMRLLEKTMFLVQYIEMARVTGVPFNYLLSRGQAIKVLVQIYREARPQKLLIPNLKIGYSNGPAASSISSASISEYEDEFDETTNALTEFCIDEVDKENYGDGDDDEDDEDAFTKSLIGTLAAKNKSSSSSNDSKQAIPKGMGYQGATVLDPKVGYWDEPIPTLDFASLYPSVMMAHNLCYSTLTTKEYCESKLTPDQYTITPTGDYFVKPCVKKGILPTILFALIGARGRAKKDMNLAEIAQDWSRQIAFNCRQLALKISANSVYGFTGATIGALPCLEVSASVTGFGREMIELTVQTVQNEFTIANGYEGNAEVIYGDTDSVMVKGLGDTVEKAMAMGKVAAKFVTDNKFIKPISLEFEKVYFPYLLISKKRYAGMLWTKPGAPDKLDQKGLETVRRDNCNMVRMSMKRSLDAIIKERNPGAALEYVKQILSDLMSNKIDISHLVISKSYSKREEDYKTKQTHIEVNKKIIKRAGGDKNLGYMLGDRIPYVLVSGRKKELVCNKAEDPIYVLENNIPIDTASYIGMLKRPLLRIFRAVEKNAESILFSGPHMTHHVIPTPKATRGSIMKFTKAAFSCLSCKTSVPTSQAMCSHCEEKSSVYYLKQLSDVRRLEGEFGRLWTHCQSCQTSFHQEILCSAKQCPIFYKRTSTRIALSSANETLLRFEDVPEW